MTILFSPLTLQTGNEVHLTSAKSLRSRVKRNFQARFCRGAWGGDSPFDLSATVSVVSRNGTVIHREFIHPGRDIDRRDKRLKSVSRRAKKTMGRGGKLHSGFCKHTYRKCRNINQQIGHIVSRRIAEMAREHSADAVVFEDLKGWKPKGGKKRSTLRQRFHGWLKSLIVNLTQAKWAECGGKTLTVVAAYTSKLAYDGSGQLKRDKTNYALAIFSNGKRYNCDLNGSYNIAARGWFKLDSRKDYEKRPSKKSGRLPRSWACLCDLWYLDSPKACIDTSTSLLAGGGAS